MPLFKGVPPGKSVEFDSVSKQRSLLCAVCQRNFKEYMKNGGALPKACIPCQDKLKNKMYEGRYPDR